MLRRIAKILQFLSDEFYLLDAFLSLVEVPPGIVDTFLNLFGSIDTLKKVILRSVEKESLKGSKQALLRENNMAVEVILRYCNINSKQFFQQVLKEVVTEILRDEEFKEVELNPIFTEKKLRNSEILQRKKVLIEYSNKVVDNLVQNITHIPRSIRSVFGNLKQFLSEHFSSEEAVQLCGSLFFLRILNPIILSPENYGLVEESPVDHRRGLILLTKILQATANGVEFDEAKEEYMVPFNDFIATNSSKLQLFYAELMSIPSSVEDMDKSQVAVQSLEKKGLDFLMFLRRSFPAMEKNMMLGHLSNRKRNYAKLKLKVENEIDNLEVNIAAWGTDQVSFWLNEVMQLPEYTETFKEEGVEGSVLSELSDQDLISLGVKALGHRKKILRGIELLNSPESEITKCTNREM